jgi:hypothetical protein
MFVLIFHLARTPLPFDEDTPTMSKCLPDLSWYKNQTKVLSQTILQAKDRRIYMYYVCVDDLSINMEQIGND